MELVRVQDSDYKKTYEDETHYYTRINAIKEGSSRKEIVSGYYNSYVEDDRLERTVHGRLPC